MYVFTPKWRLISGGNVERPFRPDVHISFGRTAHKPQKIVGMNADISQTLKDRELGFQIKFHRFVRSASLLREYVTPTLTPSNRTYLWRPQFSC